MRKGLVVLLVVGMLAAAAVPALAANGRYTKEGGMGLGQDVTRAYIGELLQLDEAALKEMRRDGLSMIAVAEKQGMPADKFVAAVVEFRKEQLAEAVAAGKVSAKQAEACAEMMEKRIQANLERVPEGMGQMMQKRQLQQTRQLRMKESR